ncbi:PBP1A family penicillin-binding protein [Rubrobacter tropicus]|uniref:PBP1A family penicillin-binding protein n=1 Tax=Rubrobacter tropicus TaxID=2653851 RepID=A0A6G8Q6N4_9ACTN|nr:transglycosylase domain-containing protein [Rubrobacter tropicus]QIN82120.1 PBP1A family penicillin-binding protein [Rubrobacter tropicus]
MQSGDLARVGRRRRRGRRRGGSRILQRLRNVFLLLCAATILGTVVLFVSAANTYRAFAEEMPELDSYRSTELAQTSTVYDANGEVVEQLYGVQNRFVVGLDKVDPTLRDAVVAIEDHRFEEHRGLDFEAIGRAAVENVKNLSIQEGGSTITQQLIKNTYIAQEQRYIPSFQRKFVEGSLAWQYEKEHSKEEILEQYLNTVYFGANAYGAEAAAKTYFNKKAADLTLPESALLAGIINLPGVYDPFADPETSKKRRDVVLDRMLEYGHITQKEHDEAVETDLQLSRGRVEYENDNEYFLNAVRKELAREYGDDAVYEGGLKIYTTLDPELQQMADDAVDSVVDPSVGDPSASLVSVDPGTGAVRAMVGGSDFRQVKFNLATEAHRQSGSAFKPFVYAEAVDQGLSPETMYVSEHLEVPMEDEAPYVVDNYDFIERGPITLDKAMADSDNTVFVQLALDLGLQRVVDMAHELGIESEIDAYPSTAIGGLRIGVTPLEMASAYSTFANAGTHMEPYLVQKVTREENGEEETVEEHRLVGEEALSRDEAAVVTESLRGVVERGTASYYHDLDAEIGRPAAGKTGTSNEFIDAWFVGYIPQLSTSVWVGYPNERRPMVGINGLEEINGENYPLDIWSLYMQNAAQKFPVQEFDTPSPDLALEVKTDEQAYVKPPPPPDPPEEDEEPAEDPTEDPADETSATNAEPDIFGQENGLPFSEDPARPETRPRTPRRQPGAAGQAAGDSSVPAAGQPEQRPASPAPASASPAADPEQ